MAISRTPVFDWSPPIPVVGFLGPAEAFLATIASRCAIGTSLLERAAEEAGS